MQVDSSTASLQKNCLPHQAKGSQCEMVKISWNVGSGWNFHGCFFSWKRTPQGGKRSEGQHFFGRRVAASRHSKAWRRGVPALGGHFEPLKYARPKEVGYEIHSFDHPWSAIGILWGFVIIYQQPRLWMEHFGHMSCLRPQSHSKTQLRSFFAAASPLHSGQRLWIVACYVPWRTVSGKHQPAASRCVRAWKTIGRVWHCRHLKTPWKTPWPMTMKLTLTSQIEPPNKRNRSFSFSAYFCQESKLHTSRFSESHQHLASGVAWQTAQNFHEVAILDFRNPCLKAGTLGAAVPEMDDPWGYNDVVIVKQTVSNITWLCLELGCWYSSNLFETIHPSIYPSVCMYMYYIYIYYIVLYL